MWLAWFACLLAELLEELWMDLGLAQVKWSPWESIQIWIQEFLERFSPLQGRTKLDIWFYSFMKKTHIKLTLGIIVLKFSRQYYTLIWAQMFFGIQEFNKYTK